MTHSERIERFIFEYPYISGAKGSDVANQQRQEELDMQKAAIARQNAQQDYVKSLTNQYVTGAGQGFDPQLLAMLQTNFMNTNDAAFNSAGNGVRSALLARGVGGGNLPVSGTTVQGLLGLSSARANSQAQGLQNIGLQNLQTALNNRWNALNILNGQPAQLDTQIGSSANAASSALNSYIQAKNTGFASAFANSLGGTLGKGLGTLATGGISGGLGMLPGTGNIF